MILRRAVVAVLIAGLLGAPAVAASTSGPALQVIGGARLAALAGRVAHDLVTGPDRDVVAAFTMVDQRVPAGALSIVVQPAQMNPSYLSIPIAISVDGRPARTVYAGYRIATFIRTTVAAHDIVAGTLLTDADLTIARVDSSGGRIAVESAALVGRRLLSTIPRGGMLVIEQTKINELVKAGQPVMLVVHDGPVALNADVIARTSGGLGEVVAVYNPATRKALSAQVTGPGKVELTLPGGENPQ